MGAISICDHFDKKDFHPLFGLIGSVLWNELQDEVASLGELFLEEGIPPVHWRDITSSDSYYDEGYSDHEKRSDEDEQSDTNTLDRLRSLFPCKGYDNDEESEKEEDDSDDDFYYEVEDY